MGIESDNDGVWTLEKGEPALRVPAMPQHANAGGDIFGGWLMSQIDVAGAIPAVLAARGRVVTVAVNQMQFIAPVHVGDMVSLYADITRIGNTSITVHLDAYSHRDFESPRSIKVADADLTYVAVDSEGNPRELGENTGR